MPLLEHQIILGRCLQAPGAAALPELTPETARGLAVDREELAQLLDLVDSPGFRVTRHVQRSWCIGRAASAAQLTLSLLSGTRQRQLVEDWVDTGGGRALDLGSEAAEFLEFVANSLTAPSHALSVCRMEQAAYRASAAALRFRPPDPSLLDRSNALLCAGKGAAIVRFFAEPKRLFDAIAAEGPLPPLSGQHFPVLFAPGLPRLYRAASEGEYAIWEKLSAPTAMPSSSCEGRTQEALEELFMIGAAEFAGKTAPQGSAV
jgi:hypothetical protein